MAKRIGLVGAPGSGKTRLAHKLADELRQEYGTTKVIDSYVQPIIDKTGIALGHFATYLGNLMIAGERLQAELAWQKAKVNSITCGTILETTTYLSTAVGIQKERDPQNNYLFERARVQLESFGLILHDTFRYDHVFYLPLPETDDKEVIFDQHLDQELEAAIRLFNIPATRLEGDTDAKLKAALQEIESAKEAAEDRTQPTAPDE